MPRMKTCKHCRTEYSGKVCPRCGYSNELVTTTVKACFKKSVVVEVYLNGVLKRKTYGETKILLKIKEPTKICLKMYWSSYEYKKGSGPFATCGGIIYPGHKYNAGMKSGWFAGTDIVLCCVG